MARVVVMVVLLLSVAVQAGAGHDEVIVSEPFHNTDLTYSHSTANRHILKLNTIWQTALSGYQLVSEVSVDRCTVLDMPKISLMGELNTGSHVPLRDLESHRAELLFAWNRPTTNESISFRWLNRRPSLKGTLVVRIGGKVSAESPGSIWERELTRTTMPEDFQGEMALNFSVADVQRVAGGRDVTYVKITELDGGMVPLGSFDDVLITASTDDRVSYTHGSTGPGPDQGAPVPEPSTWLTMSVCIAWLLPRLKRNK